MTLKSKIEIHSNKKKEAPILKQIRLHAIDNLQEATPLKVERVNYNQWLPGDIFDQALKSLKVSDSDEMDSFSSTWDVPQIEKLRQQGVYIETFQKASHERPELISKYFAKHSEKYLGKNQQLAFHQSFFSEGIVLYFPKNFIKETTIELNQILKRFAIQNILIILSENSEVNLVHTIRSQSEAKGQVRVLVEVMAQENSRLNYLSVNELSKEQPAYILRTGFTERNARVFWKQVELGEGHVIADLRMHLLGEGSESTLESVSISTADQVIGINSQITNYAPHTMGDIHQKGVTLDHSTLTFNGIGHIINQAKEANSQQESRILMLSEQARGDTNPILLIDEFEVMAGHAASIGQIPPEDLYYLVSRGIDSHEALRLYALGFLKSTITGDFYQEVFDLNTELERKMVRYDKIK